MATVALTNIKHGDGEDMYEFAAGDKVAKGDLPEGVYDELKEAGAIGAPPVAPEDEPDTAELRSENEDLQNRVRELEAQLANAKQGSSGDKASGGSQQGSTGTKSQKSGNVNPPAAG
jgi:hypothetical protein